MNMEKEMPTKTEILNTAMFLIMYLDHQDDTPAIDIINNEKTISGVSDSPDTTTSSI
tara:strand:+ start:240 stop:410 length:171 start_codon:yes stop_codon:yes gene_type:complete